MTAWADTAQSLLAVLFDVSSTTSDHSSTLGGARETFVLDVLRRFLPRNVHLGCGQAVDRNRALSRQLDVVVYREDLPLLPSGAESNLYFIEGVLATMEIKSRPDKPKLKKAFENCYSVKRLHANSKGQSGQVLSQEVPATYVFGYRGLTPSTCKKALVRWLNKFSHEEIHVHELPDLIITDRLVVIKNDNALVKYNLFDERGQTRPVYLASEESNPLKWLLLHLLQKIWRSHSTYPVHDRLIGRIVEDCKGLANESERWFEWEGATGRVVDLREG